MQFADELQVLEVATRFRLRIVCISINNPQPVIHNPANVGVGRTILLGNNDLHYVWLRPLQGAPAQPPPPAPQREREASAAACPMEVDSAGAVSGARRTQLGGSTPDGDAASDVEMAD